jgi:hypothetical protein
MLITVLNVWFEQLVSTGPKAFHYNGYCSLLCPSLGNVPKLALVHPKKVETSHFLVMVEF